MKGRLKKEDKEKLVKDLVNTYEDGNERHQAYKKMMKNIIAIAIADFFDFLDENPDNLIFSQEQLNKWVSNFVEDKFKPAS